MLLHAAVAETEIFNIMTPMLYSQINSTLTPQNKE